MIVEIGNPIYNIANKFTQSNLAVDISKNHKNEYSCISKDGIKLRFDILRSESETQKGTILLLHGINSSKEAMLPLSNFLVKNGYNSVLIDLRCHGESGGKYCTYGYYEKYDIVSILDTLSKINLSQNFGIWGQSLGAAISLQALAIDKRLNFGVIESTFSEFRLIAHDYAKFHIGFDLPFVTDYAIYRAENLAHFCADSVKPYLSARKTDQKIIMVHGENDKRISIDYGLKNYNNLRSENKRFIRIKDAGHLDLWQKAGTNYFKDILSLIETDKL